MHKLFVFIMSLFCCSIASFAQELKSPKDYLGYELGTQFSKHHQVVDYFKHANLEMPDNIKLEQYGTTYERRPLYLAFISSADNIKNLERIRENNLKNTGILEGNSNTKDITIVWLSYNVHGNEASSSEAAMNTLYNLLTEKQEWLKNTVVIIDPCMNPDGRDRYVNWFNQTASMPYNIDQQAREHAEDWPGGRPNHYLFDLNRDWAWASQIESQSRLKVYNKWLPHIHVDFHEQGINDPYYFAPAAEPSHELISDWQKEFQTAIGKNNAQYFDTNGWLYFTKERFDLLYPSYGDTYPTFMGAIGMTYEQAGHGRGGLGIMTDEGSVLTLKDRIAHHTTTGLSTVEMASKNATQINSEFQNFFNPTDLKYKSFVLSGDRDKIESLKSLLKQHDISFYQSNSSKVNGYNYTKGDKYTKTISDSDLIVSTNQPKGKMVQVLFEPNVKLKDSLTYDITAWSIPFAYGLDATASTKLIAEKPASPKSLDLPKADNSAPAYMAKWNHISDAQFLADLLAQNIKVRFTEKPIEINATEHMYERGSLIILRGDNKSVSDFDDIIIASAKKFNKNPSPINSGFSKSGPDFGSPDVKFIHSPKIAVLAGTPTSSLSYGEIWHFFEQQLHYPITSLQTKNLKHYELNKYNTLIVPDGNYKTSLDSTALNTLHNWIKKGGKIIAIDGALKSFANQKGFGLKTKKTKDSTTVAKKLIPYADRERESLKKMITGAIFETATDNTHPLAFGYKKDYYTLKLGKDSYDLLEDGYNVSYIGESPKNISGFSGTDTLKPLKNSLVFGEERIEKGSIIYMVDNVLFRSFWENGKLFFANALFLVNNNSPSL
ncbi:M14 metallopeptidase family protein [Formosa sp. S-31]|uniref:M14 family metallopeptidase n=1 Tax=Formosa sp. S-31 TaxID=2790949 RepID=UPI003EBA75BC